MIGIGGMVSNRSRKCAIVYSQVHTIEPTIVTVLVIILVHLWTVAIPMEVRVVAVTVVAVVVVPSTTTVQPTTAPSGIIRSLMVVLHST